MSAPDLKQRATLSFEPGTLSVRISGYGQQNYSGELIFDWSLVDHRPNEEDSGSHVAIDIPHSELIAIRDFLNRVIPLERDDDSEFGMGARGPERIAGGGDPATTELLKPRGNDGIVSAEICFNALLLTGDAAVSFETIKTWTQDQLDAAYDWAIRLHLQASDNDDVLVPERPAHVTVREVA